MDDNGNPQLDNIRLIKSTMTRYCVGVSYLSQPPLRATETANIILKQVSEDIDGRKGVDIEHSSCDLIREGAPCLPEPPLEVARLPLLLFLFLLLIMFLLLPILLLLIIFLSLLMFLLLLMFLSLLMFPL